MALASATKWLFGACVAEVRAGVLFADDVRHPHFRSGHTRFGGCLPGQTVDGCLAFPVANGAYSTTTDGRFFYDGGHMQKLATLVGLGNMNNGALATELRTVLGDAAAGSGNESADCGRLIRKAWVTGAAP